MMGNVKIVGGKSPAFGNLINFGKISFSLIFMQNQNSGLAQKRQQADSSQCAQENQRIHNTVDRNDE